MRTIYFLDNKMPFPKDLSTVNTYQNVVNKPLECLDFSYTDSIQKWVSNEFNKIVQLLDVSVKFDFSNIFFLIFKDDDFRMPEAFFKSENNLVAIKSEPYYTGQESSVQQSVIHESTHAATADHSLVGLAISEGIAIYMEKLFCNFYNIPFNEAERDEGYLFALRFVEKIISNVYNNDYNAFFEKIKRHNEKKLIDDIDLYLTNKNVIFKANELLRFSSILFYAKKIPNNPFDPYQKCQESEFIRDEIIHLFESETPNNNPITGEYLNIIRFIEKLRFLSTQKIDLTQFATFSTTFDRELGILLATDSKSFFDEEIIKNVLKRTLDIVENNEKELNVSQESSTKRK